MIVEAALAETTPQRYGKVERITVRHLLLLLTLTAGALLIHGYHGGVEDAEIYLPNVWQQLNPALFPRDSQFFKSHGGLTLFPTLIAGSIRLLHFQDEIQGEFVVLI